MSRVDTLRLKGSDFGFKGCLCVSIAPAMAWYPPNNFPVSTISGDVGGGRRGGMCGAVAAASAAGGSTTAGTAMTPATGTPARAATWPRTPAWQPANGRFKNGP